MEKYWSNYGYHPALCPDGNIKKTPNGVTGFFDKISKRNLRNAIWCFDPTGRDF
jgi:hypothetical protein